MDTLKDVIDDMIYRTSGAIEKARLRLNKYKNVRPVTVAQYLSSIVKLLVFLSEEVVSFRTKNQYNLDELSAKVDRVLSQCCNKSMQVDLIESKQNLQEDKQTLEDIKRQLKETLESVLTEKLEAFQAIKNNHQTVLKDVRAALDQYTNKLGDTDKQQFKTYTDAIKAEVKSFENNLMLARSELKTELLKPLKDAENYVTQLSQLIVRFESATKSMEKIIPAAEKISQSSDKINTSTTLLGTTVSTVNQTTSQINEAAARLNSSSSSLNGVANNINTAFNQLSTSADKIDTSTQVLQTQIDSLAQHVLSASQRTDLVTSVDQKLSAIITSIQNYEQQSFDQIGNAQQIFVATSSDLIEKTNSIAKSLEIEQKKIADLQKSVKEQQDKNSEGVQSVGQLLKDNKANNDDVLDRINQKIEEQTQLVSVIQDTQKTATNNFLREIEERNQVIQSLVQMLTQLDVDVNSKLSVLADNRDITLTQIADKISTIQEQIIKLDLDTNKNVALIDQEMTDHTKLNAYITDMYNNLDKQVKQNLQTYFAEYANELKGIHNTQLKTWSAEVSAIDQLTQQRQTALMELEADIVNQREIFNQQQQQLAQQQQQIQFLDQQYQEYQVNQQQYNNALVQNKELQDKKTYLEGSIKHGESDLIRIQKEYADQQRELAQHRKQWLKELEKQTDQQSQSLKRIADLNEQINKLVQQQGNLKAENQRELIDLQNAVQQAQSAQEKHSKLKAEIGNLQDQQNELQHQMNTQQEQYKSQDAYLRSQKQLFQDQIAELQATKDILSQEIGEKRARLTDQLQNNRVQKEVEKQISAQKKRLHPQQQDTQPTLSESLLQIKQLQNGQSMHNQRQGNFSRQWEDKEIEKVESKKLQKQLLGDSLTRKTHDNHAFNKEKVDQSVFYPQQTNMQEEEETDIDDRIDGRGSQSVQIKPNKSIIRAKGARIKKVHGKKDQKYASLKDDSLYDVSINGDVKEVKPKDTHDRDAQSNRALSSDSKLIQDVVSIVDEAISEKESDFGWLYLGVGGISALVAGGYIYKRHRDKQRARYYY